MCEAHFTGGRIGRSAEQSDIGDGVVRGAEWTDRDKIVLSGQESAHAVNLGRFDRLLESHGRHDGRNALGQHALARPGRTQDQQVVSPRHRDLQGALHPGLTLHVGKIHVELLVAVEDSI